MHSFLSVVKECVHRRLDLQTFLASQLLLLNWKAFTLINECAAAVTTACAVPANEAKSCRSSFKEKELRNWMNSCTQL